MDAKPVPGLQTAAHKAKESPRSSLDEKRGGRNKAAAASSPVVSRPRRATAVKAT